MITKAHVVEGRIDRWGVDGIPTLMGHLGPLVASGFAYRRQMGGYHTRKVQLAPSPQAINQLKGEKKI